ARRTAAVSARPRLAQVFLHGRLLRERPPRVRALPVLAHYEESHVGVGPAGENRRCSPALLHAGQRTGGRHAMSNEAASASNARTSSRRYSSDSARAFSRRFSPSGVSRT